MYQIREEPIAQVGILGRIPIAFEVRSVFGISGDGRKGYTLLEDEVEAPYTKDYDAIPGNSPEEWARRFDLRNWGLLVAWEDELPVGGALLAYDTEGVDMLEGRKDLAVVWDLRVAPDRRGKGIGAALFAAARKWAAERNCLELKVETQNNNVPAAKFYLRQGCELRQAVKNAYPEFPEETMLLFHLALNL
jgi:GNAT superfamily N-acetyltransferase